MNIEVDYTGRTNNTDKSIELAQTRAHKEELRKKLAQRATPQSKVTQDDQSRVTPKNSGQSR